MALAGLASQALCNGRISLVTAFSDKRCQPGVKILVELEFHAVRAGRQRDNAFARHLSRVSERRPDIAGGQLWIRLEQC